MIKVIILIVLQSLGCTFENPKKKTDKVRPSNNIKSSNIQDSKYLDSTTKNIITINEPSKSAVEERSPDEQVAKINKESVNNPILKPQENTEKTKLASDKNQTIKTPSDSSSDDLPEIISIEENHVEVIKSENIFDKSPLVLNQEVEEEKMPEFSEAIVEHTLFDGLLKKHVRNGKVNYKGLKSDIDILNQYLELLKKNLPDKTESKNYRLAFWINAYNAFTIKLILDNYPLKSITDLHGGKPWDVKWIEIGDKKLSLNNIENDIIRPRFNEPRIHFAVNCAAKSCPPLSATAFTADNLISLLEERTIKFINDPEFNSISKSKIKISKIFDWYRQDFGDLVSFIDKYTSENISNSAEVSYKEYDWNLNN
jgi:hypothetical protein